MKKALRVLLIMLLAVSLLAGCGSAHTDEKPPELGLQVLFRGATFYRPITNTYGAGAYYSTGGALWQLDFSDMSVKEVDDPLLTYVVPHNFFTSEEYIYCLPWADEKYAFTRSELDGTSRVVVVAPDTMMPDMSVTVIGDKDGSLYTMLVENPRYMYPEEAADSPHTGGSRLIKIDFESKEYEVMWESELYTRLIGVSGNSFVISQNGIYKLLDISEKKNEPQPLDGEAAKAFELMREYSVDKVFIDPYTNTAFVQTDDYTVKTADLDDFAQSQIVFDPDKLDEYNDGFGFRRLQPHAFTRDGVIVPVVIYYTIDTVPYRVQNPTYGYISREDYMRGDYNVVALDYSAVVEDLN